MQLGVCHRPWNAIVEDDMSEMSMSDVERLVRIDSIADHLGLVGVLAQWHWDEWGHFDPDGSLATWTAGLRERTNRESIPTTYVALAGDELLGSVALAERDMVNRRDLSPWLTGLYVAPAFRGQGVGSALSRHAVRQAAAMGAPRLYLHTATARGFYERLGWQPIANDLHEGELFAVMTIEASRERS
jgi:GNAT superfamily N-acetyltransferase